MLVLPSLADVQGSHYEEPHILIAERVGGMEDIPVRKDARKPSSRGAV